MSVKKSPISAQNKKFWAKPKAEQRVSVAKDVLKQVNDKFYRPTSGTYLEVRNLRKDLPVVPKLDKMFSALGTVGAKCEVCGIGGCFVSLIRLGNNAETSLLTKTEEVRNFDTVDSYDMRRMLGKVFSSSQLSLIECAFEKSHTYENRENDTSLNNRIAAAKFGEKFKDDKHRLIAIMTNIIKNKGIFKP